MAVPLLGLAATGLAGALGGSLLTSSTSSGKGDYTYSPTDARSLAYTGPSYQVQIDSPAALQTTKKEASATSEPEVSAGSGIDLSQLVPIALIIGGAVVIKELIK